MRITVVLLSTLLFLTACGSSSLNPFNWFGRDKNRVIVANDAEVRDPRALVGEIISLKVDRLPGGAIINAIGLPATQGHFEAELIPLNGGYANNGTLTYEFRLLPPLSPKRVGTQRSREVLVGLFVSDQDLAGVRRIEVIAATNRRTVRR